MPVLLHRWLISHFAVHVQFGVFGEELLIYFRGNLKVIFSFGETLPWIVCLTLHGQTLLSSYFPTRILLNSLFTRWLFFFFFPRSTGKKPLSGLLFSQSVLLFITGKSDKHETMFTYLFSAVKPVCSMSASWVVSPSGWGWLSFVLSSTELLGRTPSKRTKQQGQAFITSKERTLIPCAVFEFCFHVKSVGPGSWLELSLRTSRWSAPSENLSGIPRWFRSWGITNLPFSL